MTEDTTFWTTVPGILTGFGGVIGAVATLVTALYATGIIGNHPTKNPTPTPNPTPVVQNEDNAEDPEPNNAQDIALEQAIIGT